MMGTIGKKKVQQQPSLFTAPPKEPIVVQETRKEAARPIATPALNVYTCRVCTREGLTGHFTLAKHFSEEHYGRNSGVYQKYDPDTMTVHDVHWTLHTSMAKKAAKYHARALGAIKLLINEIGHDGEWSDCTLFNNRPEYSDATVSCLGYLNSEHPHAFVAHVLAKHSKRELQMLEREQREAFAAAYRAAMPKLEYFFRLVHV